MRKELKPMMNNTTNEILGKVTVSTDGRERIFRTNIRNLDRCLTGDPEDDRAFLKSIGE
jgi:hypothetical protein